MKKLLSKLGAHIGVLHTKGGYQVFEREAGKV